MTKTLLEHCLKFIFLTLFQHKEGEGLLEGATFKNIINCVRRNTYTNTFITSVIKGGYHSEKTRSTYQENIGFDLEGEVSLSPNSHENSCGIAI